MISSAGARTQDTRLRTNGHGSVQFCQCSVLTPEAALVLWRQVHLHLCAIPVPHQRCRLGWGQAGAREGTSRLLPSCLRLLTLNSRKLVRRRKWQRLLCQQDGSGSHRHFHSRARRRPTNPMHRRSPTARAAILRVLTTTDTSTSPFLRARRPRASPGKLQGLPTLPLA